MSYKLAHAQALLRKMYEKRAMIVPLAVGAGLAAGAHITRKGMNKAKEYQAGFIPGVGSNGAVHE